LNAASPFAGRWDIAIKSGAETYPDWLEVTESGGTLQARVQPKDGSVKPVTSVKTEGSHLLVAFPLRNRKGNWDLTVSGERISGTQKMEPGEAGEVTGIRAPALKRPAPKDWAKPEQLFNGKDLSGWEPMGKGSNNWSASEGALLNANKGANLKTTRK